MPEQACFAHQRGRCAALAVAKCLGTGCGFFKTKAQLEQERQQVFQYIQALDEPKRRYIIDVYYGGNAQLLRGKGESQ